MSQQPYWTAAELNHLEAIAGDVPMRQVVITHNRWAKANGYPQRSYYACIKAGYSHRLRFRPIGNIVTLGLIQQTLDISGHQAREILDRCQVRQQQPLGRRYVERIELRRLARRHPELFAMATKAHLVQLLEDDELAEWIKRHQPLRMGRNRKPIVCLETGETFPSVMAAATAVPIDRNWLTRSLRHGTTAAGFHWAYVDQAS